MATIALIGAGGKMGCRITDRFKDSQHRVLYVETGEKGLGLLAQRSVTVTPLDAALAEADTAILAVPDVLIEAVSREVVEKLRPGSLVMTLDPAAPLDGKLHQRDDIRYFIAHPCHPSIFAWEPTEAATRDFYGGVTARQAIVCALMKGTEEDYAKGESIAIEMYGPISTSHRVTLEQMAMLEPALVETLAQTCIEIVKEGYDKVVEMGVPEAAARDFVLGHLRIQIAVLFKETNGVFSDAAYKISKRARKVIFKDDWQRIFEMDDIREQVRDITTK